MGIENRNGILADIDYAKAQVIEEALLKGKDNLKKKAKELGLKNEQVEYLLNAFFGAGEVQIGDRLVVKNKGTEKDARGDWQLSQTINRGVYQIEGSKVGYSRTDHNLNTDEVETKYFTDADEEITKAEYKALQKNIKFFPVPGDSGCYVGISFKDRTDKDGNVIYDKNGKPEQEPVPTYYSKELIPISEKMFNQMTEYNGAVYNSQTNEVSLHHSKVVDASNPGDILKAIVGGSYGCSEGLVNLKQEMTANVVIKTASDIKQYIDEALAEQRELTKEVLDAIMVFINNQIENGKKLDAILAAIGNNSKILNQILNELMKGNQLLQDIRGGMETNNKQNDEILKVMMQILEKLESVEKGIGVIINKFPGLSSQLTAILNAIKNNPSGSTDSSEVLDRLDKIIALLTRIGNSVDKLSQDQAANFLKVINAINNIGNKLTNLEPLLNEILNAINNNTANDDKNAQLILDAIANLKLNGGNVDLSTIVQLLNDIKDMFANCGAKLDAILAKLNNFHGDVNDLLNQILQAIKDHTCNCNCGNGNHEGILDDIDPLIS